MGDHCQTQAAGSQAARDLVDTPSLAHLASRVAVERMAGLDPARRVDPTLVPGAVHREPRVASFGRSVRRAAGVELRRAVFPLRDNGKAAALGRPEGQVKLLLGPANP